MQREQAYDRERDQQPWRRWYKTAKWQQARADFLADPDNQFCVRCQANGLLNPGIYRKDGTLETNRRRMHLVVNHVQRHHGEEVLFWDRDNWEPLCPDHHDIDVQAEERQGTGGGSKV
ncbi:MULTISPECIES: HNH endonuclease [unclassified Ensifer]|uniref:HNH endonuclease n=1 Tax=unclassified Ensifer TaxID=2633371 RepID=UPI0011124FDF|nr:MULTISPECIES: HNH endonuclease [unclassified Ensifer]